MIMDLTKFEAGEWIIGKNEVPAYFMYRLVNGKVSIFSKGKKVNTVEVKKGQRPVMLGVMAMFKDDGKHSASVKAETESELEMVYIDSVKNVVQKDLPDTYRKDLEAMIETIILCNELKCLQEDFREMEKIVPILPEGLPTDVSEVLKEVKGLYEQSLYAQQLAC